MNRLLYLVSLIILSEAIEEWQPVLDHEVYKVPLQSAPSFSSLVAQTYQPISQGDQCGLHKVSFTQDLYFQYIQYKTYIPEMREFTLCYWTKYVNHSTDHPLFSYAGESLAYINFATSKNLDLSFSEVIIVT